jgi:hypothetical protein
VKDNFRFLFCIVLGALALMTDAFINGFPIVYSDTSTYLASGFQLETPFDRPITYGLFLRVFSLNGLSTWLVVFAQATITSTLIFLTVKLLTGNKRFLKIGLITSVFLALFTGLSWTVSQLMPDIFTPIALLCIVMIFSGEFKRGKMVLLYVLFLLSVAMHISHILLYGLILIAAFIVKRFFFSDIFQTARNSQIAILLALTIIAIVTMGSAISKSKHVFFMGAMVEHGILQQFLDDKCNTTDYKLCVYRNSLPEKAYQFVWDEDSPFYKIGGWKESKQEFNEIIFETLTTPKYIGLHIKESLKATFQQLVLFKIGDGNGSFPEGTQLHSRIHKYFPNDLDQYANSRQNQSQLGFLDVFNSLFSAVIILSLIILVFLQIRFWNQFNGHFKLVLIVLLTGILLNAWDCGTFANAIDRLGCKMIWLIPFMAILSGVRLFHVLGSKSDIQ